MDPTPHIEMSTTPELEMGVPADFVGVWHQPDVFVIDFAVHTRPPQPAEVDGRPVVSVQARMTARVRIPPAQVFEIMRALEQQLSAWERETGRRPQEPPN